MEEGLPNEPRDLHQPIVLHEPPEHPEQSPGILAHKEHDQSPSCNILVTSLRSEVGQGECGELEYFNECIPSISLLQEHTD